jgi:Protein of unknown function (DUF3352)
VIASRGAAAPPDGTARLVPPDALLYVHASTSEGRTQDARLQALAGRFSSLRLADLGMAFTPAAGALDFARDVRPWLGEEVALALVAGPDRPQPLLLAAVADRDRAVAVLRRLGARSAGAHNRTPLLTFEPRAFAAFAGEHLVVGPEDAVRGAIDRAAGAGVPSLADGRVYRRAAADRDGAASVDVFATSAGLRRLLDGRSGFAGFLGRLLTSPQLEGVGAQLAAEEGGVRVTARVIRAPGAPRRPTFEPALAERVPEGTAAFLALPGMGAAAELVSRAGGGPMLEGLREALPAAAGLELEDVLAPLGGEAALTVSSGEAAPVFTLTARTRDEARTREVMARLQEPVAERLAGGAPFTQREVNGAEAFSLPVTPELEPSYAVAGDALVASTDPSGLGQLAEARTPLTQHSTFEQVDPGQDDGVEALGFFAPRQLLALGERTGLQGLGSPALRDDLRRISTAAAVVREDAGHPSDTTAELFLEIP